MSRAWMRNGRSIGLGFSSVPSWEKTFCTSVCRVPWRKICEAKDYMLGHKNVADWDDSGALEAFENAKTRYWSEINGLTCDVPMPDPDSFIDEIDHSSLTDPELIADLEKEDTASREEGEEEEDLSFEVAYETLRSLPVVATGWGDVEEGNKPFQANEKYGNPRNGDGWSHAYKPTNWRGTRCDRYWRKQKKCASNEQENTKTMRQWRPKTIVE